MGTRSTTTTAYRLYIIRRMGKGTGSPVLKLVVFFAAGIGKAAMGLYGYPVYALQQSNSQYKVCTMVNKADTWTTQAAPFNIQCLRTGLCDFCSSHEEGACTLRCVLNVSVSELEAIHDRVVEKSNGEEKFLDILASKLKPEVRDPVMQTLHSYSSYIK